MVDLSILSGTGFYEVSALYSLEEAECMTLFTLASVLEEAQHERLIIPNFANTLASFLE